MQYRRSAGLVAVLGLAVWCSAGTPTLAPAWVERMPDRPGHHIGIGRADKAAHPLDYREAAQAAALSQISREISVRLKSESRLTVEETGEPRKSFSQEIRSSSANELAGYERVDQYETAEAFWVYYALDKETYRAVLEEKEARDRRRYGREAAALEADLEARRIQPAADRWASLKKDSEDPARRESMAVRWLALSEGLSLKVEPAVLIMQGPGLAEAKRPRAFLSDASGQEWRGPLSLELTAKDREAPPCRLGTDADGRLDPEEVFLRCGMAQGRWTVTWKGPEGMAAWAVIEAKVAKADWSFTVRSRDFGAWKSARWEAELSEEMAGREGPLVRWKPAAEAPDKPRMEIELRQAAMDSLDGIHFTALHGWIRLPGVTAPREIHGKAGHADPAASKARALRDFARDAASQAGR